MESEVLQLLRELPPKSILWMDANGNKYTAQQMIDSLEIDDPLGITYMLDTMRVVRDLLQREANSEA